jgi:hypothetical protein
VKLIERGLLELDCPLCGRRLTMGTSFKSRDKGRTIYITAHPRRAIRHIRAHGQPSLQAAYRRRQLARRRRGRRA